MSQYHQYVRYTRLKAEGKPDRLIPTRVSWFTDMVKVGPGKSGLYDEYHTRLCCHTRVLDFNTLYSGHCQWVADDLAKRSSR